MKAQLSIEQVIAVALPTLTPRELSVSALVCCGTPSKAIAEQLGVSVRTIENHRYRLRRRLGLQGQEFLRSTLLRLIAEEHRRSH